MQLMNWSRCGLPVEGEAAYVARKRFDVVGTVTKPLIGQPRNFSSIPGLSWRLFYSPELSHWLCGPTSLLWMGTKGTFPAVKRPEHEGDHLLHLVKGKKVKWSRYRPGVAQRVGRGIALVFHDRGSRRGWEVSSTPWPNFIPGKDPVPILQEAGWAPGPIWTGGKSHPHRDLIPDHQGRRQSLYRLSYPAHTSFGTVVKNRWNCFSSLPYAFMACTGIILRSPVYTCIRPVIKSRQ